MNAATVTAPSLEATAAGLEAVARAFEADRARIVVRCEPDVVLSPEQAGPVQAIARRAIANALTFAYPDRPDGKVWLSLTQARGRITLSIRDAGVGVPVGDEIEIERAIVEGLATQLHGYARIDNRNYGGAEVTVTFPAAGA